MSGPVFFFWFIAAPLLGLCFFIWLIWFLSKENPNSLGRQLKPQIKVFVKDAYCPLCRENASDRDHTCSGCNAVYHRECMVEMSRGCCATIGCRKRNRA